MAVRARLLRSVATRWQVRKLFFEQLEDRRLLALTHLYTFNDGLANDWIGSAHGTMLNGATATGGQLVLSNVAVTSGQTGVVQYMRLPANVLGDSDATVEVWYTASDSSDWARVFDVGNQVGSDGDSYLFFSPQSGLDDSRAVLRPGGLPERVAGGVTTDDGTQHMAAIVIDTSAGLLRLYLDGAEVGTAPLDGANAGSVNDALAYVGRSLFNADPGFTGSINELRIYDEAVAAMDVANHAIAGPSNDTRSPLVRQMEYLDRGMVALRTSGTTAYVGWRLLGTDPAGIEFNIYRSASGGPAVKLNPAPLAQTTNFVDTAATGLDLSLANAYFVAPVLEGVEQAASESFTLAANTPIRQYLNVPIQAPAGGTVSLPPGSLTPPSGTLSYTYSANDGSVGDLDGDGQYEIILKWEPSNAQDNANEGLTGPVILDAYKLDGTRLWRINLGHNIRAGAHYTQFLVYDFDGDGRAEVVMKTADGTVDGLGNVIGNAAADFRDGYSGSGDSRWGRVLAGPEYLTVFDGLTGTALSTIDFSPPRGSVTSWGDNYGNRVDRFLATVAYLDGVRPSIVMARGYYAKTRLTAFDWRDGQLAQRWAFDSATPGNNIYQGQGNHNLSVGDVDFDGKDEIIYGAAVFDDTGVGLHTTGFGHGDAMHVSDMVPTRPGLEVFQIHEPSLVPGSDLRDARTGQTIYSTAIVPSGDEGPGRGAAFDIDPNHAGYESWDSSAPSIYNALGVPIYAKPSNMHINFGVWWDGDLLRETLDGTTIGDWNFNTAGRQNLVGPSVGGPGTFNNTSGLASNNGSKATPTLTADILGDWREEVIWRRSDNTALTIWTTATPATNRLYTLMHDPQYRQAIAWQNVAYNQPPHPGFFLGAGMATPPTPQIYTVQFTPGLAGDYNDDNQVDTADYVVWRRTLGDSGANLPADGDGDGTIGSGDYDVWSANFGASGAAAATVSFASGGTASTLPLSSTMFQSTAPAPGVVQPMTTRPREMASIPARPTVADATTIDLALVLLTDGAGRSASDWPVPVRNTGDVGGDSDFEPLDAAFAESAVRPRR